MALWCFRVTTDELADKEGADELESVPTRREGTMESILQLFSTEGRRHLATLATSQFPSQPGSQNAHTLPGTRLCMAGSVRYVAWLAPSSAPVRPIAIAQAPVH